MTLKSERTTPANLALRLMATAVIALGIASAALGFGCGGPGTKSEPNQPARMALDESPLDAEAAEEGARLFQFKGCSACHAFGRRVTGPDLAGVARRRSRAWIEDMLRRPEVMVREDQTARELLSTYLVAMPNLKLTDGEVHALVEFLKSQESPGLAGKED